MSGTGPATALWWMANSTCSASSSAKRAKASRAFSSTGARTRYCKSAIPGRSPRPGRSGVVACRRGRTACGSVAPACWMGIICMFTGLFPSAACTPLDKPLALARIHRKKLAALDNTAWEYWCKGPKGERWADSLEDPVPLFRDAAPEMTVSRIRGIEGLVATYTSVGLSKDILVRHAAKPEGPWSQPLHVYRCPDAGRKGLLLWGQGPSRTQRARWPTGHYLLPQLRRRGRPCPPTGDLFPPGYRSVVAASIANHYAHARHTMAKCEEKWLHSLCKWHSMQLLTE